jgi:diacylglycerol kinase family enzyme
MSADSVEEAAQTGRAQIRKVLVIYNPRSGTLLRGSEDDPEELLRGLFAERGIETVLHAFEADALSGWITSAEEDSTDAVVVCGGDGSILAVVAALGDSRLPIGLIPGGTMNILARDAGLPSEPAAAADVIAEGVIKAIDVGLVNGKPFLCNSAIGLMPHLARSREQMRDLPLWRKWPRVVSEFFTLLRRYPRLRVTIQVDGSTRRFRTRALAVSNNLMSDSQGPIPTRESLSDGVLGIYVARETSRWALLRIALRMMVGTWQGDLAMETITAKSAVLSLERARPLSVMNDGEPSQFQTPLEYTIRPRALRVLVPDARES